MEAFDRESSDKISAVVGCDAPLRGRHMKRVDGPEQSSIAVSKMAIRERDEPIVP